MLFNNYVDDLAHQMIYELGGESDSPNIDLWVNIGDSSVFTTKLMDDESVGDSRFIHMCHLKGCSQLEDVCNCLTCTRKCEKTHKKIQQCAIDTVANEIYDNMYELEDAVREYVIDEIGIYINWIAEINKSVQVNVLHNMSEEYEDYDTPIIDDIIDNIMSYGMPYRLLDALSAPAHQLADDIDSIERATENQLELLKEIQELLCTESYREAFDMCYELGDLYDGL